jgi:putative heme-binding domain-containing protein
VAEVKPLLKGKRDLECGKTWFRENACVAWHLFKNEVGVVCPDLNLGTRKFGVRELVESITEPGKTISNPYGTTQMKIKNSHIFVSRKINGGRDMFQLPDNIFTSSEVRTLKRSDISKSEALPVSLMLSGLVNTCRPDEVADLFAWLQSGAKGAPHRSQTQHAKFTMNRFTLLHSAVLALPALVGRQPRPKAPTNFFNALFGSQQSSGFLQFLDDLFRRMSLSLHECRTALARR